MKDNISIALIQCSAKKSPQDNIEKQTKRIADVARFGLDLIVLQELHNSLYFCQEENPTHFDLAEDISSPNSSLQHYAELAKEHSVHLVCSLFEKRDKGIYHNTAFVLSDKGEVLGKYRKMHIPDDPCFYEKFYFTPGDLGFEPIQTPFGKLGVLICWDQWFPEAARLMAMRGADILIYPTAIGWDNKDSLSEQRRQFDAWVSVQQGHAIANGIPLIAVNRVGYEAHPSLKNKGINFWGGSFVCDAQGQILEQAGTDERNLLVGLDLNRSEEVRRMWPFFRDRRTDTYYEITKRYLKN